MKSRDSVSSSYPASESWPEKCKSTDNSNRCTHARTQAHAHTYAHSLRHMHYSIIYSSRELDTTQAPSDLTDRQTVQAYTVQP